MKKEKTTMGRWGWFWMSEEIAQLKAFRDTLNPNSKAYADVTALIEKAEAETEIKDEDVK